MKFNVGDILINKDSNYVLVIDLEESNIHFTRIYKVIKLNNGLQYTWNVNHVDYHYEKVS